MKKSLLLLSAVSVFGSFAQASYTTDWKMTCYLKKPDRAEVLDVYFDARNLARGIWGISMNFRDCSPTGPAWFDIQISGNEKGPTLRLFPPMKVGASYELEKSLAKQAAKFPWCGDKTNLQPKTIVFPTDGTAAIEMSDGSVYSGVCEKFDL